MSTAFRKEIDYDIKKKESSEKSKHLKNNVSLLDNLHFFLRFICLITIEINDSCAVIMCQCHFIDGFYNF